MFYQSITKYLLFLLKLFGLHFLHLRPNTLQNTFSHTALFNACINLKEFYAVGRNFYITIPNLYQPSCSLLKGKGNDRAGKTTAAEGPELLLLPPFQQPHPDQKSRNSACTLLRAFNWGFSIGKQIADVKINLY